MDEYSWTTGAQDGISHVKMIAAGGYGEVHQVHIALTSLTTDVRYCFKPSTFSSNMPYIKRVRNLRERLYDPSAR